MSVGRAKPESRLATDRLFPVSDRVRVTILKSEPDSGSLKLHYRQRWPRGESTRRSPRVARLVASEAEPRLTRLATRQGESTLPALVYERGEMLGLSQRGE